MLRRRLIVSLVLSVPVIAMALVPALQFTNWQWLSLTLAAPVVVWGAWPFTRPPGPTALRHINHGHPDLHGKACGPGMVSVCPVLRHFGVRG